MKKIIFIGIVLLMTMSFNSYGQTALNYSEVVKTDSVSKDELFERAKVWLATSYNNSKSVIQLENKNDGVIIGKASMKYDSNVSSGSSATNGVISYLVKIYTKDNRYKYEITDFLHEPRGNEYGQMASFGLITDEADCKIKLEGYFISKKWNDKVWNDIKNQINKNITPLIESLKTKMQQKAEIKNNNW